MTIIYYEHFSQCKSIVRKPHKTYIIPNISIFGKYVSIPRWSQCLFSQVPSMSSRLSLALPSVSPLALVLAQFLQFWCCFGSRNDCKVYSTCRSSSQSFSSCVFVLLGDILGRNGDCHGSEDPETDLEDETLMRDWGLVEAAFFCFLSLLFWIPES